MSNRFTEKAEKALNNSVRIAEELGHTYIGTEHIMLALSEDELSCSAIIFKKKGYDHKRLKEIVKDYSGTGIKTSLTSKDLTPRARSILEASYNTAIRFGDGVIGTEHILLSLLDEKDSVAIKLLRNSGCDVSSIKEEIYTLLRSREKPIFRDKKEQQITFLKQHGKNLCDMARAGKFDPVIGRDKETERTIRILCRKNKNNPCLIGEAGVGKTAIVEGLAARIANGDVPHMLRNKIIISVDLTSMVAGAKYRGDFEDRIKNVVNEATKNKDIILFIDEIHTIVGAGAAEGAIDASNILKPQLARGDIQLIGATTFDEYHKYIEKDTALERRFQPVIIEEPDEKKSIEMLTALRKRYEDHHGVTISDEAIRECVVLSSRYINDRYLPDKAIDVMDEACVIAYENNDDFKITGEEFKQNKSLSDKANNISYDIELAYTLEHGGEKIKRYDSPPLVDASVVRTAIAEMCKIPYEVIRNNFDFPALEESIKSVLIGQDKAIQKIVSALKRNELGFVGSDRPKGIFMLIGESGTGKTSLAIELSKNIYYNTTSLLRYDMSEFAEKQSISKLIGSPPGYVGHEEGGLLTEAVRRNPHAIILFDEIEKADKDVLNILLQIADYGYLTDSVGRHVNFRNTIIIMTGNIGASALYGNGTVGFINEKNSENAVIEVLKKHYKEEFISRFDEIICFEPLTKKTLIAIAKKRLEEIRINVLNKGCYIKYDDGLADFLANKSYEKGMGARPLLREIANGVENPVADIIIKNPTAKEISVSISDETVVVDLESIVKI